MSGFSRARRSQDRHLRRVVRRSSTRHPAPTRRHGYPRQFLTARRGGEVAHDAGATVLAEDSLLHPGDERGRMLTIRGDQVGSWTHRRHTTSRPAAGLSYSYA